MIPTIETLGSIYEEGDPNEIVEQIISANKDERNNFYFPHDIQKLFVKTNDNYEPKLLNLLHFNAIVEENKSKNKKDSKNSDKRYCVRVSPKIMKIILELNLNSF